VAAAAAAVKEAKAAGAVPTLADVKEKKEKEAKEKVAFGVQDAPAQPADMFSSEGHPDLAMARKQETIEYA